MLYPAPLGALTQLWGGTMPETAKYNGEVTHTVFCTTASTYTLPSLPVPRPVGARRQVQTRSVRHEGDGEVVGVAGGCCQGNAGF